MTKKNPPQDPLKYIIGSVACGRFDPLLRRHLSRARINFPMICDVYIQVHMGLEDMFAGLLGNDDGSEEEFAIDSDGIVHEDIEWSDEADDEEMSLEDLATDIFLQEVLPAFAEVYPEATPLTEIELQSIDSHPIIQEIIKRNRLTIKAQKILTKKVEHAILEDVATALIDTILKEMKAPKLGDLEEVDVSQCIEQRLRKCMKL